MRLEANLGQTESYLEELAADETALPTRTFDRTVTLNVGRREIPDPAAGAAATPTATYSSPAEGKKSLRPGDALIDWMPFMNDG